MQDHSEGSAVETPSFGGRQTVKVTGHLLQRFAAQIALSLAIKRGCQGTWRLRYSFEKVGFEFLFLSVNVHDVVDHRVCRKLGIFHWPFRKVNISHSFLQ